MIPHPFFICRDCQCDTGQIGEYYMLHDEVWRETGLGLHDGMLCIGCAEARLQRQLTAADFIDFPINHGFFDRSERMVERVGR